MNKEMTNVEVAELLRQVAAALEVKGEDFFRYKAYENAAASIEHTTSALKDLWEEGQLDNVSGLGPNLISHLSELFKTGKVKHFDTEFKSLPEGMFELLNLPGIGPKTAYKLAKAFKLTDEKTAKEKLLKAAEAGKIDKLEGFGADSQNKIINALNLKLPEKGRMLLAEAESLADEVKDYLGGCKEAIEVEVLGSLRRRSSTIGDVDLAIKTKSPLVVLEYIRKFPGIKKIIGSGEIQTSFLHKSGRRIDIKTQTPEAWGSVLQHYTGSKLHNIHLRKLALEKGLSLSENGIKNGEKFSTYDDEINFYEALGMEWIPSELREDRGEIELALQHRLPKLVELNQIKGDLHIHSNIEIATSHDEGENSVKEIMAEAERLHYEYVGIADHNPRLKDLTDTEREKLISQRNRQIEQEIYSYENSVKTKSRLKVLKGMEVDIRSDGELALTDKLMEDLDYVIASVHSAFDQDKETATKRILKALDHEKVKIWGHPSGRMIQERLGLDYDWERVFEFCRKKGIFVEINSWPKRLDLSEDLIKVAIKSGVKMIINTDSHKAEQMKLIEYGVNNARRGWAEAKDIANTLPWEDFKKMIE
jgi:DNA polymerase (family 10)